MSAARLMSLARRVQGSRLVGAVVRSRAYYRMLCWTDALALTLARRRPPAGRDAGHLVFAPTGGGNIGDQALLESYLQHVDGPVTMLSLGPAAFDLPGPDRSRVSVRSSWGFTYAPPPVRLLASVRMASTVLIARSVSVIGADLMDGSYSPVASLARSSALWLGAACGKPSILLGCSWADTAVPTCAAALHRAGAAGAQLNLRDEVSLRRATDVGIGGAALTADIVFDLLASHQDLATQQFVAAARRRGRRVALVNASGLVGARMDQIGEYVDIVEELRRRGFSVILVPHVFRDTDDDLAECVRVLDAAGPADLMLVDSPVPPGAVRTLCGAADLVVTGRMHLAVMALSQGTLAITLGTHGKVEGLYRHFGDLGYTVDPGPGFGARVVDLIGPAMEQDPGWTQHLPAVKSLAASNFRSIAARGAPVGSG